MMLAASAKSLEIGSIHAGVVKTIMAYGAFVSLEMFPNPRDGLLHISQLDPSGRRVDAVGSIIAVGDRINVRVLSIDGGKVSLSCRDVQQGIEAPQALRLFTPGRVLGKPPSMAELERLDCVRIQYSRSSGSGGQNVNKLSTKCEVRLMLRQTSWPEAVQTRLLQTSGATKDGILIIVSERHRTQSANRKDAIERMAQLVANAWYPPKLRQQRSGLSERGKRARRDMKTRISEKKRSRNIGRRVDFD